MVLAMTTNFTIGGVVRCDDYFFNKPFVEDIWESLQKDNVLLVAPRRTGKTSLMYRLLDAPRHDYKVIHLNVETITSPGEFFLVLLNKMHETNPDLLKRLTKSWRFLFDLVNRVEEIEALDFKLKLRQQTDWESKWKEIAEKLILALKEIGEKILFILDELPDMLNAMSVELQQSFLHQFRAMRQNYDTNSQIRWLVGGSVNIHGVLSESGLIYLINDFKTEVLPLPNEAEVKDFVVTMLQDRGVGFEATVPNEVHKLLGSPIPFFLQLFTQELCRHWKRKGQQTLDPVQVEAVFRQSLLGEAARDKLQHYYDRIRIYYSNEDQDLAYALLNALARANMNEKALFNRYRQALGASLDSTGRKTAQEQFKKILLRLASDFYIAHNDQSDYHFTSYLLQLWWQRNWMIDDE